MVLEVDGDFDPFKWVTIIIGTAKFTVYKPPPFIYPCPTIPGNGQ